MTAEMRKFWRFMTIYAIHRFKIIQALTDDVNRLSRENLTGLLVVRACNVEMN